MGCFFQGALQRSGCRDGCHARPLLEEACWGLGFGKFGEKFGGLGV